MATTGKTRRARRPNGCIRRRPGSAQRNPWVQHVMKTWNQGKSGMSYDQAMVKASATWK